MLPGSGSSAFAPIISFIPEKLHGDFILAQVTQPGVRIGFPVKNNFKVTHTSFLDFSLRASIFK